MKTILVILLASWWFLGCSKDNSGMTQHRQVNVCWLNKTENDFVAYSYLDGFGGKINDLPKNETACIGTLNEGIGWKAHLKSKDFEFATWEGSAYLGTAPSTTVEITPAHKTFDFRDRLVGKYDGTVNCVEVDLATKDTLSNTTELLAGDVTALPNVLELKISTGSQFDGIVTFSEDLNNFITSAGESGQFSPIDLHLDFITRKMTAAGIKTTCRYQGEKH